MIQVEYLRHAGDDLSVVNAARVSFSAESNWTDNCTCKGLCNLDCFELRLVSQDAKLIDFLARHKHKSPFNHAFATFRVKAPIFVARQLVKHEYMPWNEISRRYVEDGLEFYFPELDDYRSQPENVKQGSGESLTPDVARMIQERFERVCKEAEDAYRYATAKGLSREQARMILPQSLMTEWVWSGSLYAFAKMCQLRLDSHAQKEASYVAYEIDKEMQALFPISWEALKKHGVN
jgi:thymidylate synthase (FAD)